MRTRPFAWLGLGLVLAATQIGCCGWDRFRSDHPRFFGQKPNDPFVDRRDAPPNYPIGPPPGMTNPGGAEILTPQPYPPGAAPSTPAPATTNSSGFGAFPVPGGIAPAEFTNPSPPPRTSDSLSIPNSESSEPPKAPARRMPPPDNPPVQVEKTGTTAVPPSLLEPNSDTKTPLLPPTNVDASSALPVGIPNFAEISDKLAMGLKADPEGLDWLRDNNYRTVVHVHRPGADLSAHKEQVEKRGLKYTSFELSPSTLTQERLEEFGKIIADPDNQTLFVYDDNGASIGALWYLHLRSAKAMPAEVAKAQAGRVGFRSQGSEEQEAFWTSIQSILNNKQP